MMKIYNTLNNRKEDFCPLEPGQVKMLNWQEVCRYLICQQSDQGLESVGHSLNFNFILQAIIFWEFFSQLPQNI